MRLILTQMETLTTIGEVGTGKMKMMPSTMQGIRTEKILTSSNLTFKGTSRLLKNCLRRSKRRNRVHGILSFRITGVT
jgi:ABC-type dipeptide/oligopeptide/nickel transport system ATPase component